MDPATIIGTLSAAGTIVAAIGNVAHDLSRLRERYREADTTIGLLLTELFAIQGALRHVELWSQHAARDGLIQEELVSYFEVSLEGCRTAVSLLSEKVAALHEASSSQEHNFRARARTVWHESALKDHQQHLRSQVQALSILIQTVQIKSLAGQAAELRQPSNRVKLDRMKEDTISLRTVARSTRCDSASFVTRAPSTIGDTILPIDAELVESGPYRTNGSRAVERHRTNALRAQSGTSNTRRRTEHYTSQGGSSNDGRSTSPRQELAERMLERQASESREDRIRLYAQNTRSRPPEISRVQDSQQHGSDSSLEDRNRLYNQNTRSRPSETPVVQNSQRHVSDPSLMASGALRQSESRRVSEGAQDHTHHDDTSTADSELLSPTITVQDTESVRTAPSSSSSNPWTIGGSSQTSFTTDNLHRSSSVYSWRAEPHANNRSPPSLQLAPPSAGAEERLGLWGTIRRHPSVARLPIFGATSRVPSPASPVSPTPGSRRGHIRADNDTNRSVDFKLEELPDLVEAAQEGNSQKVEYFLDQGADIEAVTSMTRRTALAVASHCGKLEETRILLGRGASLKVQDIAGMTPLHLAADRGHVDVVKELLSWGAVVDCETPSGTTPLRLAADSHRHDVADILLKHRARVNARDRVQFTALHAAAKEGDMEMVNLLIAHNADLQARDASGMAAIHYAAEGGHCDIVDIFLARKVHIDYTGRKEKTPLMIACGAGQTEMVKLLLRRKAKLSIKSERDMTALHWACYHGQRDVVELLVEKKVALDARTSDFRTPLHLAVMSKSFDTVEFLLRNKAAREVGCAQSWRPLHYACHTGEMAIVDLLLHHKASFEATNNEEQRPIHIATIGGNRDLVRKLIGKGATFDCFDKNGERPLTLACTHGHLDIVRLLLENRSALRMKFRQGQSYEDSPICVAARHGHLEIVAELIKWKASVRQTDERGWQPLRYAAYYGHTNITELLLQQDASVLAMNLSAYGISNSVRVGFDPDVPDDQRAQILDMLQTKEAIEQSQQAASERHDFSALHGISEIDSSASPAEAQQSRNPFRGPVLEQNAPESQQTHRSRVAQIAAMSSRISSAPSVLNDMPSVAAPSVSPIPSQSSLPRRAQTTRPRSTLSGIFSDEEQPYTISPMPPTTISRSITMATPRIAPPTRTPPAPPAPTATQTPPPAYFAYRPPSAQHDSSEDITAQERQQLLNLTCNNCKYAGKETPDFSCASCRSNVFRYDHRAQQDESRPAVPERPEDVAPRMYHNSGPVYEMPAATSDDA